MASAITGDSALRDLETGGGLAADSAVHLQVERQPLGELWRLWRNDHALVVDVACGDHAARFRDPAHLAQHRHGISDVLQHLVCVRHVKTRFFEAQRVGIACFEAEI